MKIFITGASGFLGKRLITRLQQDNYTITALSRSKRSDEVLHKLGVATVSGSLTNIETWATALNGQDVVVHAASPIDLWGAWSKFEREIVQATEGLYLACAAQGVGRFIYISSESVLQDRSPLLDIDETFPTPTEPNSYYGKAKKLAEVALLKHDVSTECLILRPTFIWGAGDTQLDNIVEKVKTKQFMWIDGGQATMEMVHVENVVEAIRLALTKGHHRDIYLVTDDTRFLLISFFLPC